MPSRQRTWLAPMSPWNVRHTGGILSSVWEPSDPMSELAVGKTARQSASALDSDRPDARRHPRQEVPCASSV
jgi:hypothetical protein